MSPILVRPVREQLEHDRVIRLLQVKYKRKFDVAINPGNEHGTPVGSPDAPWYPDLVLQSPDRHRRVLGVVEVETVESVNHLEAMSQWAALARLKAPFHLYVPAGMVEVARRFCTDLQISVSELWAYQALGDQVRFTPIQRTGGAESEPLPAAKESRVKRAPTPKAARAEPGRAAGAAQPRSAKPVAAMAQKAKGSRTAPSPGRRVAVARKPVSRGTKGAQAARTPGKKVASKAGSKTTRRR